MHRLFVACRPPAPVRAQLCGIMGGVEGARWQSEAQLHLTLRFIGEVDGRTADDLASALEEVAAPAVMVALSGVGCFERKGRAHSLWAGIAPKQALVALHQKIDRALVMAGQPFEERTYQPHITLARGVLQAGLPAFIAAHAGLTSAPFRLDSFTLFESLKTSEGMHYRAIATYPLRAAHID